ncbi:HNH endonuclease signature motif containing protein [Solirubrobacter soli]|uniref:HNH endonuclease signature motif containing protein n=1 Tax=Solirubrobacter soli TaxID=363832 RepID=UPI0012F9E1AE|nr:HNH endonuclease [Solirubrobacter soli]
MQRYARDELEAAVAVSATMTEVLRHFGLRPAGGNHRVLRHWLTEWEISTEHFTGTPPPRGREPIPLEDVLVESSQYSRRSLKQRLYDTGLKDRVCELCGQNELWNGRHMSLVLDHINGRADDNRLENLRIVCPNCNATLETHCGKANLRTIQDQACERCGRSFRPKSAKQRFCSRECGTRWERGGLPRPGARRVERPSYEVLVREVEAEGWRAVGRRYGVSDNAVRKWVRGYERARAGAPSGRDGVESFE